MISRRELVRALTRRKIADWIVVERSQELATAAEDRSLRRSDDRRRWTVTVHHDLPQGRGTAHLELGSADGDARELVEHAVMLATAAVGPIWRSTPPAAPAKVELLDPDLADVDLLEAAASMLRRVRRPEGSAVSARIELLRERVSMDTASGFRTGWRASRIGADALVSVAELSLEVARVARRSSELELDGAIADAAADLAALANAGAPVPGRCALILGTDALLHGGGFGVWAVFADQASAEVERQGLTRYRLATPIAPGADQLDEPLTVASNGALDFGARSAPVGDEGDAVRRFTLIDKGVSVGLGLGTREASRRRTDPNGGVRNLVIGPGTWNERPPGGRSLEIRRLRSLAIDPHTGDASLELALAIDREGPTARAITGGTVRLDLISALARARRSATTLRRGAYVGPASALIEDAELLG